MTDQATENVKEKVEYQTISEFLESTPPNQLINISNLCKPTRNQYGPYGEMRTPEIQLHCDNDQCNGTRFFRCVSGGGEHLKDGNFKFFYVTYRCSNCQQVEKTFSLAAQMENITKSQGSCYKFGELPTYGPPIPSKLIKLIGPDREEFLKGRRCENQGLGVGAFIYYRRVVENQKERVSIYRQSR
ncbi:MAG: hypothetical protein JW786_09675 [Desulfobacterales bacterium]|nr:hypothetical protein [Desulfobacterales bacterium]